MGSSYSNVCADTCYTHPSWYTGEEYGKVTVRSAWVKWAGVGVGNHHYITVSTGNRKWIVYQWGNCDEGKGIKEAMTACAVASVYGNHCATLGTFKVNTVYEACKDNSYRGYSVSDYNCNHWCENVAYDLTGKRYKFEAHGCGC